MNTQQKYIIGKVALWNNDRELFYAHIGLNKKDMPLAFTAWGKTEDEAMKNAEALVKALDPSPEVMQGMVKNAMDIGELKAKLADIKQNWDMGLLTMKDYEEQTTAIANKLNNLNKQD